MPATVVVWLVGMCVTLTGIEGDPGQHMLGRAERLEGHQWRPHFAGAVCARYALDVS